MIGLERTKTEKTEGLESGSFEKTLTKPEILVQRFVGREQGSAIRPRIDTTSYL